MRLVHGDGAEAALPDRHQAHTSTFAASQFSASHLVAGLSDISQ
jgi:hypothetical protein